MGRDSVLTTHQQFARVKPRIRFKNVRNESRVPFGFGLGCRHLRHRWAKMHRSTKTALTSPKRSRNGATLCWLRFAPKHAAIATENVLIRGSGATTEKSTDGATQPLAT